METRQNRATYNRPEGDRVLDGNLVRMNIPDSIRQLKSEAAWQNGDRNGVTLLHNSELRLVLTALKQNAEVIPYTLEGASYIQVLEGRVWVETSAQSLSLDAGDALALAGGVPRSFFAEEEAVILLTLTSKGNEDYDVDFNRQSTF